MAGAMYPAVAVDVVSPQFCVSQPMDLTISRKLMTLEDGTFGVTDLNGNLLFKIRGKVFSLHDRRVLLDAAGNPIITFQQKVNLLSIHLICKSRSSSESIDHIYTSIILSGSIIRSNLDLLLNRSIKSIPRSFRLDQFHQI